MLSYLSENVKHWNIDFGAWMDYEVVVVTVKKLIRLCAYHTLQWKLDFDD